MKFYEDDVAIVSYASVFPDCDNEDIFFDRLLNGECLIRDLTADESENAVQLRYHFSKDKKAFDKSYSKFGTKIPLAKIREWAERNELDMATATTVEIIMHELCRRMEAALPSLFDGRRSELIVALSTGEPDPIKTFQRRVLASMKEKVKLNSAEQERIGGFMKIFDRHPARQTYLRKETFSSLIFESVRDRFGIEGTGALIDAACASSLAAVMLAIRRLQEGDRDLVITGGIDVGTTLLTLMSFSKLQILSEGIMNPFDKSADGINEGEGAALFALMRLKDARAQGLPILAVIRNCDGSSDGVLGGMVEPTEFGQNLAYENAYRNVPMYPVSYLECHGTGTKLGDQTELASTAKFFHPLPPIGSVKANAGHLIGAAGAASMVKCLKIIENRIVPKMPNFKKMNRQWSHVVHKENFPLPEDQTIRVGISSFGFGGANFHMVMDEYRGEALEPNPRTSRPEFKFVLNGSSEIDLKYVYELFSASKYKIPPVSLPYADPAILGGILAAEKLFAQLGARLTQKQREKIGVISNSNSYLERLIDAHDRICHLEVIRRLDDSNLQEKLIAEALPNDLEITEDTFMWGLNNLIAGRITKDFDLKGPNFNVANEKTSLGVTLEYARALLKNASGAYLIIHVDEDYVPDELYLERSRVRAFLVSDLEFSLAADLPIAHEVLKISSKRREDAHAHA